MTSPWVKARPQKVKLVCLPNQLHRVGCFPRNSSDAIKLQMRVCNRLPEKTGSRPVSSWSQVSHLIAFFSVILFHMKDLFYLLRLLFFCNCLNKNWKCSHFNCPHAQKPAALLLLLISTLLTLLIIQNLLKLYCTLRAVNCYYFYCRFFPYALSHVYEKDSVYHIDHSHKTTFS